MCGIVTYFNKNGLSKQDLKENLNALKAIKHRGPDGEGAVLINVHEGTFKVLETDETPSGINTNLQVENYEDFSAQLFIGHRRLSIIDTSINGHQPMSYADRYWITYNGEVYNYIEIRNELQFLGYNFKTESDTEVILAAYDKWKEKAIERFNGMFSIVIYDIHERKLFIGRDRFGVKPLYYFNSNDKLILISETLQINSFNVRLSINNKYLKEFLATGYLDYDNQTVYNEITRYDNASYSQIDLLSRNFEIKVNSYYSLNYLTKKISDNDAIESFDHLFKSAVNLRMRSDVPLGCSLSGGLDSSLILSRAYSNLKESAGHSKLNTFSVVFPGMKGDESKFVQLMIDYFDVKPHLINAYDSFTLEEFEKQVKSENCPIQSTSYSAQWLLAKAVRAKNITVLLNGQGGDEILAGYHHHFYRYCRQLILGGQVLKYLSLAKKYANLKDMPFQELQSIVINDLRLHLKFKLGLVTLSSKLESKWNKPNTLSETLKYDMTEYMMPTFLRSDDIDFMNAQVETRHPFLDYRIVDFCNSLPANFKIRDGWQKWLLRQSATDLPVEIRYRKDKKGYTTPEKSFIEKNILDFENYLKYIPAEFDLVQNKNIFFKYALGVWFKQHKIKNGKLSSLQ